MNDIVKCSNRNCGLITELSNWVQVKDENNPRASTGHCPRCYGHTFFKARPGEKEKAKRGAQLITLERNRQTLIEGWSPEHDDAHTKGGLSLAGTIYALLAQDQIERGHTDKCPPPHLWPWPNHWWKPSSDPVRNLVKAGALIAAEIDRLQRLQNKATP